MAAATLDLVNDINGNRAVEAGATYRLTITWTQGTPGVPVNLTGYTARMQFRPTAIDTNTPLLSLTETLSADGQLLLGGTAGTVQIYIKDTKTMGLSGSGVYDLELQAPVTGDVTRLVEGKYVVNPNVTR